jgi:hypothetical protein
VSLEPIGIQFEAEGVDEVSDAFDTIAAKAKAITSTIEESNKKTEVSYKSLASNVAYLSTAALSLESTWNRVAEGQASVAEGALRSIPALVSLGSAIWTIVTAQKARAVASAIAQAIEGMGTTLPVIAASATAGAAVALAATAAIPSMGSGGVITAPTVALLGEGGETEIVSPESKLREVFNQTLSQRQTTNYVTIIVQGDPNPANTAKTIMQHVRAAGES